MTDERDFVTLPGLRVREGGFAVVHCAIEDPNGHDVRITVSAAELMDKIAELGLDTLVVVRRSGRLQTAQWKCVGGELAPPEDHQDRGSSTSDD